MSDEQGGAVAVIDAGDRTSIIGRRPVIDLLHERQLALLLNRYEIAKREDGTWGTGPNGLSLTDIASMLELAGMYLLDPFANEIWVARGKPKQGEKVGKLLLMTARDGLRKIADRNHLDVDGDVVREKDVFIVERMPDRSRAITHKYTGSAEERGPIVGAWSEAWDRKTGRQRGYFFAPISEYKPDDPNYRSPWRNQVSTMILGASERQSIRQATPLGGLLVEGEAERNMQDAPALEASGEPAGIELPAAVEAIMARAAELGHAQLADRGVVEIQVGGQPPDVVMDFLRRATVTLDEFALQRPRAVAPATAAIPSAVEVHAQPGLAERRDLMLTVAGKREIAAGWRAEAAEASAADDHDEASRLLADAADLEAEADALEGGA